MEHFYHHKGLSYFPPTSTALYPLETTTPCSTFIILSFQKYYINGTIQYVTLGDAFYFFTQHNSLEIYAVCLHQ